MSSSCPRFFGLPPLVSTPPCHFLARILLMPNQALGVLQIYMFGSHANSFIDSFASRMSLAYYIVCVFLNTTLTSMICYRIVRHGKLVHAELGREYSLSYFAIAEIIIESALPFTLSGIAFLVTLGLSSQVMVPFEWVYFMMTVRDTPQRYQTTLGLPCHVLVVYLTPAAHPSGTVKEKNWAEHEQVYLHRQHPIPTSVGWASRRRTRGDVAFAAGVTGALGR